MDLNRGAIVEISGLSTITVFVQEARRMKRWIGRWFMVVAVLHTALAFVMFKQEGLELLQMGVYNGVLGSPTRGKAAWFTLFGVLLFLFGMVVDVLERAALRVPFSVAIGILALAGAGVLLMPHSGFWLVLPPAVAILVGQVRGASRATPVNEAEPVR
jgi:hypothetical protein